MPDKKILFLVPAVFGLLINVSAAGDSVSLTKMAAAYGFPEPRKSESAVFLKSPYTAMTFSKDSRKLLFNGILIWMSCPATRDKNGWNILKVDAENTIRPLLTAKTVLAGTKPTIILLDPGHGGKTIGAISARKIYEKSTVLDIASMVKELLSGRNISVKMTRDGDQAMDLASRTVKASKLGADLFVSIHMNYARNKKATGIETYILSRSGYSSTSDSKPDKESYPGNKHDKANMILAYDVHRKVLGATSAEDRGIKQARFNVLCEAPCPAILIECGFLSNVEDESRIMDAAYRKKIAGGIAEGILEYIGRTSE